ncbi:hypothetical protein COV49_04510 [Candidatus Falkowbacteria bacterium CG11_big_fil_rev_8_21_14_0_20_39_10]|uniref:Septum formation initiator n=1 Tax=Candidatus Falkowbacteria bacterium CG11_big_fil_rev_8_21_14_0_20_39_10 TaxID=1974570 RepID=A0A2M6K836_9BACT|nr:MAG: hypothetical protein COV49_04510 [Candidatus Falkowbacteria bacterium CG11_big_fil_rev_8_21_14_0_20_39_10]
MTRIKRYPSIFTRIIYNPKFLAFLGLLIIVLISIPLAKKVSKRYVIDEEIKGLETEIQELGEKNKDLKEFITYLESDQFLEEQARLNLNLKKPGEEVVVIQENLDQGAEAENLALSEGKKNRSNPEKWLAYFFN